jgi:hypothetical protein
MGLAWTPPVSIEFVETLSYHRMGMLAYPSFKMAKVQQIYSGVDFCLGPKLALSPQGKDSLRFFVNHIGVTNGHILPYDEHDPGWRATEDGLEFLRKSRDDFKSLRMLTQATGNFAFAMNDIYSLVDFYDKQTGSGKPAPKYGVFKRTATILTVTAWETFVEDTLTNEFTMLLQNASTPDEVQSPFNLVANKWRAEIRDNSSASPKPPDFKRWTGDHWKELIQENFEADIIRLNTPNSQNVQKLFKRYLAIDVKEGWKWPGMSSEKAASKLDALIRLRGELVHRGNDPLEKKAKVPRKELVRVINLVERLVRRTQIMLEEDNSE